MVRLRHVVKVNPSTPAFDRLADDQEVTFLPMENIWPDHRLDLSQRRTKAATSSGYTRFQDGDILVPKITPTFEAGRSVLVDGLHNGVGAGTTELHVLRPGPEIHPRFLFYIVNTHRFLKLGTAAMYGVAGQRRVPDDFLRNYWVDLPSIEEQSRIVSFLDAETTRIDTVVEKRKMQQRLLAEKSAAAVLAAIAGLYEPGERRVSGLSWLPTIPADWPVMPIGYQFEVLLGKMLNQVRTHGNHLRPYLRNTNVQWDQIDTEDLQYMDFPPEEQSRYRVLPGDLLICEGGEPGRAAIWDGSVREIYYQKALHRARPRGYSSARWLYYCLRAATIQNLFAVEGNTTTITHLTGEQIRACRFPFPPRSIQDRLTAELDELHDKHRRLAAHIKEQQSLLIERKQALITAAVTGQIDTSTASDRATGS